MQPSDDLPGESFRGLVLRLRGRTGLTQRDLATQVGVHVASIHGWEIGANYPGVASLQALIAVGLQTGGFTPGREREEAEALWGAALRDAPRFRTPFDGVWFERLFVGLHKSDADELDRAVTSRPAPPTTPGPARRESWGEAPDIAGFLNRASEREMLRQWVLDERSRLVAVFGLGGIGKSLLATRLAHDLAPSFERVFWRSLRDAPTPGEWLTEALGFLAPDEQRESDGEPARLRRLLELLGETRCLLVLDNVETVLQPGGPVGAYRPGYERYGTLLRQVAESPHRSCLVVTSREEPAELGPVLGEHGPIRALDLGGLAADDGRALLRDKQLDGDEAAWQALVERFGGNCLALKVVGETTRELFGGSIVDYLEYAAGTAGVMVAGVRQLLGAQIARLSELEQELLRHLAVEREPIGIAALATGLGPRFGRGAMLTAVEALRRRSLLERTERGPLFGLHSVVLEYVTDELVEEAAQELAGGNPDLLTRQPLLKASAKEYVRRSQERLIAGPILERLVETCGSTRAAEQLLLGLLDEQRRQPVERHRYGPGNVVNLLRLLRGDLKGVDLSGLMIRQAYLHDVEAHDASLAGTHLSDTVLGEAFSYPTSSLALSADGAVMAVGTSSGAVCFWRVADRALLATLPGHAGAVHGVAVSGDGRLVASGGVDGTVRLWEAASGRPLALLHAHTGGVWDVALSGDGRLMASAGADGTVRLWETTDGRLLATLQEQTEGIRGVAVTADGGVVGSGGLDGAVRLWDARNGRLMASLQGQSGGVWCLALSRDGSLAASGGVDGTVWTWDVANRRLLATLHGHTGRVEDVALSEDGRLIASSSLDGTVRLWQAMDGQLLATMHGHSGGVRGVALCGDGQLVASSSVDGTVRLWEAPGGRPLAVLHGHESAIMGVALSGDGQLVASASLDGTVRLRETESGQRLGTLRGHTAGIRGVAVTMDGRLVASGGLDGTIRLWEARTGYQLASLQGQTGGVWCVALSRDGSLVAGGGVDGSVRLWHVDGARPLTTLDGHDGRVYGVALSGDGRLVASSGVDGTIRLWDVERGILRSTLRGHDGGIWRVALSQDGRLVASGGFDGTVRLWEADSGKPLATFHGHNGIVYGIALSGDRRLVASSGFDGTVRLWEVDGGRPLAELHGHDGRVYSVALSEDGRLVASSGVDGTVRLWASDTGACVRVLRDDRRYERMDITGLTGVTEAQRQVLLALGAVERSSHTSHPF